MGHKKIAIRYVRSDVGGEESHHVVVRRREQKKNGRLTNMESLWQDHDDPLFGRGVGEQKSGRYG